MAVPSQSDHVLLFFPVGFSESIEYLASNH